MAKRFFRIRYKGLGLELDRRFWWRFYNFLGLGLGWGLGRGNKNFGFSRTEVTIPRDHLINKFYTVTCIYTP